MAEYAMKKHTGKRAWFAMATTLALAACGNEYNTHTATLAAHGQSMRSDALTEGECDLDGTWAVKISVPVRWAGGWVLKSGNGELTQFVKSKRTRDGDVIRESLTVCGVTLPDNASLLGHKFGTRFPDSLFDNDYLDVINVDSHYTGYAPGDTFQTDPVISQLGVAMPSPLTDSWPASGADLHSAVDNDQDGHPGVTLYADQSAGYSLPPATLTVPFTDRAAKFYTAVRNVAHINGTQQTCDWATGSVSIPRINGKLALNSHVLGCELSSGANCSVAQTKNLDGVQPVYQTNGAGTITMIRTDDDATCADIRNFTYIR